MQISQPQASLKHHRSYLLNSRVQLGKRPALCLGQGWWEGVAKAGKGWWEGFVQNQVGLCLRDSTVVSQEQRDGREGTAPGSQEGLWLITCGGSGCHEVVLALSCFPNPSRWTAKVETTLLG